MIRDNGGGQLCEKSWTGDEELVRLSPFRSVHTVQVPGYTENFMFEELTYIYFHHPGTGTTCILFYISRDFDVLVLFLFQPPF